MEILPRQPPLPDPKINFSMLCRENFMRLQEIKNEHNDSLIAEINGTIKQINLVKFSESKLLREKLIQLCENSQATILHTNAQASGCMLALPA